MFKKLSICLLVALTSVPVFCSAEYTFKEIQRFPAKEAHQGVAVDEEHFYAIDNQTIGKYNKVTGDFVARWQATPQLPLVHLNSGIVLEGRLYCAHSNSPGIPQTSSVEIWDTKTLEHVATHSFGIYEGSLTWIDHHQGSWWAVFARYTKKSLSDGTGRDGRWTSLVKFNDQWVRQEGWVFPEEVLKRFAPHSNSGGGWGPGVLLYCTGHYRREFYALRLPSAGSTLHLVETIVATVPGQAFAWDRGEPSTLWGIDRQRQEVVVSQLRGTAPATAK